MRIKSRLYPESTAAIDWIGQRFGPNDQAVGLIPAAGIGSRSGLGLPKQYYRLGGVTVLARMCPRVIVLRPARDRVAADA